MPISSNSLPKSLLNGILSDKNCLQFRKTRMKIRIKLRSEQAPMRRICRRLTDQLIMHLIMLTITSIRSLCVGMYIRKHFFSSFYSIVKKRTHKSVLRFYICSSYNACRLIPFKVHIQFCMCAPVLQREKKQQTQRSQSTLRLLTLML